MNGCGACGARLDVIANHVGRRDTCPHCGADLHACQQCRHFDEGVAKECKEPFAEVPDDKVSGNFCDLFQIGEGRTRDGGASKEALLSAAESLFKKR
jgi:predicted RNA-binding Zn-ribbon protein involved in translation (DUF1610 family)